MRVPTSILDIIKPILLEQKDTVHCKFTSNNGEIHMTTINKNLKKQNYLLQDMRMNKNLANLQGL